MRVLETLAFNIYRRRVVSFHVTLNSESLSLIIGSGSIDNSVESMFGIIFPEPNSANMGKMLYLLLEIAP